MTVEILAGDCLEILPTLAADSIDACVTDLAVGIAAEHLVCADLLLSGWRAFLADQNCGYDVAVDVGGRLIRIQVKATRKQRWIPQRGNSRDIPAYMWHVRRAGKGGKRLYKNTDFDMLALVAIDVRLIAYLSPTHTKQTIHIRPPSVTGGKQFNHFPFADALSEICR